MVGGVGIRISEGVVRVSFDVVEAAVSTAVREECDCECCWDFNELEIRSKVEFKPLEEVSPEAEVESHEIAVWKSKAGFRLKFDREGNPKHLLVWFPADLLGKYAEAIGKLEELLRQAHRVLSELKEG